MSRPPTCPVCGTPAGPPVERHGPFTILPCPACGLQFADPLSDNPGQYRDGYAGGETDPQCAAYANLLPWLEASPHDGSESRCFLSAAQAAALRWMDANLPPGAPVLDIGCGVGWFLSALRARGYRALGLDVAEAAIAALRRKDFQVATGTTETAPPDWPAPRAVTLFEVLEHVADPVGLLAQIRTRFPQTPLLVSTPSPRRWTLALARGVREAWDYPPHHLMRWTDESLRIAFSRSGYKNVDIAAPPPDHGEAASVPLGPFLKATLLRQPPLQVAAASPACLRPFGDELRARRLKQRLFLLPTLAFRALGWSGISYLIIARG